MGRQAVYCCVFFFTTSLIAERTAATEAFIDILHTSADFLKYLFTRDTMKIITGFTPVYLAARMSDEHIHSHFYCSHHHKNLHQLPDWCHTGFDKAVTAELVALSFVSLLPNINDNLFATSRCFAISLPYTWLAKKFLKEIRTDAWMRPRNELFGKKKCTYQACPSGHMMEAIYAATLFGKRCGPAWGVPLGIFAGAMFADFINANRHFVSQLVAGAGLGVIFAYSADKTINEFCERNNLNCSLSADHHGRPSLSISCSY